MPWEHRGLPREGARSSRSKPIVTTSGGEGNALVGRPLTKLRIAELPTTIGMDAMEWQGSPKARRPGHNAHDACHNLTHAFGG